MSRIARRLASTAATASTSASRAARTLDYVPPTAVSTAHIRFPPPAAQRGEFDANTWARLQPPPPAALHALAARVGLAGVLADDAPAALLAACTHPSFVEYWRTNARGTERATGTPADNANLAATGNALLGLFASEWLHASFPHLPTRVLKAAVSAYVGPLTCASVAKEMGVAPLLRWHRVPETPTQKGVMHADALASVPRALTALVYTRRSLPTARKFAHAFFLSRAVDLRPMLKFTDPKKALKDTLLKLGRERPASRMLKETGRFSNSPMYVVGIYSGADKLGEGFGSSIRMAEYRAAEDAMLRLYLTRTPPDALNLPTATFTSTEGDVFASATDDDAYSAPELGQQEVLYGGAGRSRIVLGDDVRRSALAEDPDHL